MLTNVKGYRLNANNPLNFIFHCFGELKTLTNNEFEVNVLNK